MFNDKKLNQQGGDGSQNIQAVNVDIHNGLSYDNVRQIAMDVFHSNILIYKDNAKIIAEERAIYITEKLFSRLIEKNIVINEQFKAPGLQDSLFSTQKEFAKSGDLEMGGLMIELLTERINAENRDYRQIIINEALLVIPKLTSEQIDFISIIFILTDMIIYPKGDFTSYLTDLLMPLITNLRTNIHYYTYSGIFKHIEYTGCGIIREGSFGTFENRINLNYSTYYQKEITREYFENIAGSVRFYEDLITLKENNLITFKIRNTKDLSIILGAKSIKDGKETIYTSSQQAAIHYLFTNAMMSNAEIKEIFIKNLKVRQLVNLWNNSKLNSLQLSDVGQIIAIHNINIKCNQKINMQLYIR